MALKTWSFFKEKSIRRVKCNGEKKGCKRNRDNCKISSLLKSNSEIGPLFEFFAKSVHFVMKVDRFCKEFKKWTDFRIRL
jgi:hypothetical protein